MSWSSNSKNCLTCVFWMGFRTQKYKGSPWETKDPGTRGKCAQNVFCGVTQGPCACSGSSCTKYVQMPNKIR